MHKLPDLPYKYSALEPYIDEQTMKIHHGKHHAGYVSNLNKALEGQNDYLNLPIKDLLVSIDKLDKKIVQTAINNGGGHANHSLFWDIMSPKKDLAPMGEFKKAFINTFSKMETFKEKFTERALTLFGSGWVFLIVDKNNKLSIKRHSFQNSPLMHSNTPILGLDVWEHAYYLKYQNKRNEYINAWWNVVNWEKVSEYFEKTVKKS